ncbi:MAG: asparagine synthase (glutamine-hydrolyzing) [Planctomycetota bacterium]|nr:asparagine synthase (glutamine-hydrolyzing) [Planctomycetota bacterium]
MCGLAGVLCLDDTAFRVSEPYLVRLRDTMLHRGPDGAGVWSSPDGTVGLAHRRLSIIDLSTSANQPMSNEDGMIWLVFNGEIYNHAEVRAELQKVGGHVWRTDHSDTEVIIHAYEQWGIDCLQRFRGMFAIAIWDRRTKELWLVRDRLGIKPLYYSQHHGRLTFASEIKALLADAEQPRVVHEEAFFHYLSFLASPAPQTLFDGIRKLPAGCYLHVRANGQLCEKRYWEVWDHTTPLIGLSDDEIAARVLDELRTSVRLHAVSDVPVGIFLSGGIDSSTNAALFSETTGQPVRAFTIGYQDDYP